MKYARGDDTFIEEADVQVSKGGRTKAILDATKAYLAKRDDDQGLAPEDPNRAVLLSVVY